MDLEVSRFVENKNVRNSYRVAIEDLLRGVHNKRGSMDRKAIDHPESSSIDRVAIKKLLRMR